MSITIEELLDRKTSFCLSIVVLLLLYSLVAYPGYLSPLARIPAAHPSCHFSNVWIKWHRWRETDLEAIQQAFGQHGSYIRLGPKEVAINSKEGFNCVYGIGSKNLDRSNVYDYFMNYGVRNMFTSLTATEHTHRRERIADVYTKSFVQQSRHVRAIIETVIWGRLVPEIQQAIQTTDGVLDVLPLTHALPMDTMSAFVFGLGESHNTIKDRKTRQVLLHAFLVIFLSRAATLLREFKLLTKCLAGAGFQLLPHDYHESKHRGETWAMEKVSSLDKQFQQGGCTSDSFSDGYYPILFEAVRKGLLRDAGSEETAMLNARQCREAASECLDHINATIDTYGMVFSYIFYQLSRKQEIQRELQKELATINGLQHFTPELDTSSLEMPASKELAQLPLLNGIIRESLRLRNSPPGMDPRVTPPGRLSTIGPYDKIPPGVRVGAYTYLLHRKEELYDDPLEWSPSRWIGKDTNGKMPSLFAFSGGTRGCIGRNLSDESMRQTLAAIYANFKTSISDDSTYPGDDGCLDGSGHEKLWIKFERL